MTDDERLDAEIAQHRLPGMTAGELREQILAVIDATSRGKLMWSETVADALLSGPLAPLLADLGHARSAGESYRRQRNMLADKLAAVEELIDPATGMATGNGYNADRLFTERDIRRALDASW